MAELIHNGLDAKHDPEAEIVFRMAYAVDRDGGIVEPDHREEHSEQNALYWTDKWDKLNPAILVIEITYHGNGKRTWRILKQGKGNTAEQFLMTLALMESLGLIRAG
jgi:hypothetical protein